MNMLVVAPESAFREEWPGWGLFLGNGKAKPRSEKEWFDEAIALSKQMDGLPQASWLQKNGYKGLYRVMRLNPEKFLSFKRSPTRRERILMERVLDAEAIAHKNGGILPHYNAMRKYYSLVHAAMRQHPGSFAHIRQKNCDNRNRLINDSREKGVG